MAKKHGAVGLDLSSNQIRFLEMNQSRQIIKSKVVDFDEVNTLPFEKVNELLSQTEHKDSPVVLLMNLKSEVAFSSPVPNDIQDGCEFINWKLAQLLPQASENYVFNADVATQKDGSKNAVSVALNVLEVEDIKSSLINFNPAPKVLDSYEVAVFNLVENFFPIIGESYISLQIEDTFVDMLSFVESGINYREKVDISDQIEISSIVQHFLERQYSDSAETPIVTFGSKMLESNLILDSLSNPIHLVNIDPEGDEMVESKDVGSLAIAYALALRGLEV